MKTSSLRSFATFAALRFKFFGSASRAAGDKPADRAGPPYRFFSAKILRSAAFQFSLLLLSLPATASTTWNGPTWNVSTAIPDNDDVGLTSTQTVGSTGITQIENVTVTIHLTGGWNGDLYGYLVHESGFSVLLNRAGRSLAYPDGSAASGMSITFADSATSDVHTAIPMSGGSVAGTYQPDGRITDPLAVLNTDPRPAMLDTFTGLSANGNWTLFLADQSAGGTSTLQSWSMTITGVPEPSSAVLGIMIGAALLLRRRR